MSNPKVGSYCKWGCIQDVYPVVDGVCWVGTAGHGGLKLDRKYNLWVDATVRRAGGWYEEDCEWSIAVIALAVNSMLPSGLEKDLDSAHSTMRNWYPDEYTCLTGRPVLESESNVLRRRAFEAQHANDWVTICANGIGRTHIPEGMVVVTATIGGTRQYGAAARHFLVPVEDYKHPTGGSFVVDTDKYQEIGAL